MPRTAIYTEEEKKHRQYLRNKEYIKNRCATDPEYRAKQCEYVKKCVAKKKLKEQEELQKLRSFYEQYKDTVL